MANLEKMALESNNSSSELISSSEGIESGISLENIESGEIPAEVLASPALPEKSKEESMFFPHPAEVIMPLEVEVPVPNSVIKPSDSPIKNVFSDWTGLKEYTAQAQISPYQAVANLTGQKLRFEKILEEGFFKL